MKEYWADRAKLNQLKGCKNVEEEVSTLLQRIEAAEQQFQVEGVGEQ